MIPAASSTSSDADEIRSQDDDKSVDNGNYIHIEASISAYRFITVRGCLSHTELIVSLSDDRPKSILDVPTLKSQSLVPGTLLNPLTVDVRCAALTVTHRRSQIYGC